MSDSGAAHHSAGDLLLTAVCTICSKHATYAGGLSVGDAPMHTVLLRRQAHGHVMLINLVREDSQSVKVKHRFPNQVLGSAPT